VSSEQLTIDGDCKYEGKKSKTPPNLVAWQKTKDLVKAIYKLTQKFPDSEHYGLNAQMRGEALSVPSNIAEGAHCSLLTNK